jgi:hypothetical protein
MGISSGEREYDLNGLDAMMLLRISSALGGNISKQFSVSLPFNSHLIEYMILSLHRDWEFQILSNLEYKHRQNIPQLKVL